MSTSPLSSPVVLDASLTDEKLAELLGHQAEYPELDYKERLDLSSKKDVVELAKDVGAMQVRGGYIIVGADDGGKLTGGMDGADPRPWDEASLRAKLQRYLPDPLELRIRVATRDGHTVVMIYVGPHTSGCAVFKADGQYQQDDKEVVVFRQGDIFWRKGTSSARIDQQGFDEVVNRRVNSEKDDWLDEQRETRRDEQEQLLTAFDAQRRSRAALGSVNFDLDTNELIQAVLELLREDDRIALRTLLKDATARARQAIERGEIETELADVVDKLTCLAATLLEYEEVEWFERVVRVLSEIYSMAFMPGRDARWYALQSRLDPNDPAPRIWLLIVTRVMALGALAVRLRNWRAVFMLATERPARLDEDDANWLRHALTMASRAQHLEEQGQASSLISLARSETEALVCLRPDGTAADDEAILDSLVQFDALSNIAAIGAARDARSRVFYPNFARFRQERIQPTVERLLTDPEMRAALFPLEDDDLALALKAIEQVAHHEGLRYAGFETWAGTPIHQFIAEHSEKGRAGEPNA